MRGTRISGARSASPAVIPSVMRCLLLLTLACGPAEEPAASGRWRKADDAQLRALQRLGYVDGTRPAADRSERMGVVARRPTATAGWRLYTSGHEAGATLIDLDGAVVWHWGIAWSALFPADELAVGHPSVGFWRRAALLPDGGVVAVYEGLGMVRLDAASNVVWKLDNRAHHDLQVVGEDLWVLVREVRVIPDVDPVEPVLEDQLVRLDLATGAEEARVSVVRALIAGGFGAPRLTEEPGHRGDVLHTNSLVVLEDAWPGDPAWSPGRVLVSLLATDSLALVDPVDGRAVWARQGPFRRQHDPHPLPDGRLLLFDNHAGERRSRVMAWSPSDPAPPWTWGEEVGLWSDTCGAVEPLPGGHLLVTESDGGRAFEIDAEGRVVWAFASPHRSGARKQLVATLFQMDPVPVLPPALVRLR